MQYTDYHFKAEEKMLEIYNYCDEEELAVHKEKHRAFVQKVGRGVTYILRGCTYQTHSNQFLP